MDRAYSRLDGAARSPEPRCARGNAQLPRPAGRGRRPCDRCGRSRTSRRRRAPATRDLRWYTVAAARRGEKDRAARILGACEQAESELDAALEPHEQAACEELIAALRAALTDDGFEAERANGRSLSLAAATELMTASAAELATA
jgi:hypothetical protein